MSYEPTTIPPPLTATAPPPSEVGYDGDEVKRKRGRPRKYPVDDGLVAPTATTTAPPAEVGYDGGEVKRRIGRPRKYPVDDGLVAPTTATTTEPPEDVGYDGEVKRQRGRPRKYPVDDVLVAPTTVTTTEPPTEVGYDGGEVKRRIGRPRKYPVDDGLVAPTTATTTAPPAEVGYDGGEDDGLVAPTTATTTAPPAEVGYDGGEVKRRIGRPRKYPVDDGFVALTTASAYTNDGENSTYPLIATAPPPELGYDGGEVKRRIGRPRKYPVDDGLVAPKTATTTAPPAEVGYDGGEVKRQRGRPRKYPVDDGLVAPTMASAYTNDGENSTYPLIATAPPAEVGYDGGEVKRRRGRPRKYPVDGLVTPTTATTVLRPHGEMETRRLTEYERIRLENIKRNNEMLASFKIKSKLDDLTAFTKPHREKINISHKVKPKIPTITRRSLRTQGKVPDSTGLKYKIKRELPTRTLTTLKSQLQELEPISMKDAITCYKSDQIFISQLKNGDVHARVKASIDLDSMKLAPKNIANTLPGMIRSIKFFPSTDTRMVVVGNNYGTIAFWNVDSEKEDGDGIYRYHTNPGLVSAILIQPFSTNKITTSCYGGRIRSLDIEKEIFALSYSTDNPITSMSQQLGDVNSLYFGKGEGVVCQWDQRSRKSILSWDIHESVVNTIDFNPENTNIMATSSSDETACIWDLRKLSKSKPEVVKLIVHKKQVSSAYFSPSGSFLATTSVDDQIGVLSGTNYDEEFMITRNNQTVQTGGYFTPFKGIWGWDDSYIFVGNQKKGVDVISAYTKTLVTTLESPHMSAIPCRFDAHPCIPGMLAGAATGLGEVYIWTS